MPTERYTLSPGAWRDAGPTPCILQLRTIGCVMVAVGTSLPDLDDAPAHCLTSLREGGSPLALPMDGERVYLRADHALADVVLEVAISRGLPGSDWASPPVDWRAPIVTMIAETGVPQVLFAAGDALHGGTIVNTSTPGSAGASGPLLVDVTGGMGPAPSSASVPVYPALDPATVPGAWRVPPTRKAVTIRGPAGATFTGFSG